jgi:AICAR transformylase/IMP cyclohydrolase PurH
VISFKGFGIHRATVRNHDEVNIVVDRAKIVSLITAPQMRKLTRKQASELEGLIVKERNRAIQKGNDDLDIVLGYYLVGLNGI